MGRFAWTPIASEDHNRIYLCVITLGYGSGLTPSLKYVAAVQDQKCTFELFQKAFCRVDWRLFDPATLTWRFDGEDYVEKLKKAKSVQV